MIYTPENTTRAICSFVQMKFLTVILRPTNKIKSVSLIFSDGYFDSGFLPLFMSMETLKNHLLTKFCKVHRNRHGTSETRK